MAEPQNRYKQMEFLMICALGADLILFIIYMIAAGGAVIWLKAITAVLTILLSVACLGYMYLTKELTKRRSFWITLAAGAILLCTILSLILNYPSPNPLKVKEAAEVISFII